MYACFQSCYFHVKYTYVGCNSCFYKVVIFTLNNSCFYKLLFSRQRFVGCNAPYFASPLYVFRMYPFLPVATCNSKTHYSMGFHIICDFWVTSQLTKDVSMPFFMHVWNHAVIQWCEIIEIISLFSMHVYLYLYKDLNVHAFICCLETHIISLSHKHTLPGGFKLVFEAWRSTPRFKHVSVTSNKHGTICKWGKWNRKNNILNYYQYFE